MNKEEKEFNFPKNLIKTSIFERILNDLGITKSEYCTMRGDFSRTWFYTVLRKRGYLNHQDIKTILNPENTSVSINEFTDLCLKYGVNFDANAFMENENEKEA